MSHQTIAPGLLLAMPQLMDPFHRAVVLMIEHNDSGSLGVVVNRPVETRLSAVMDHLEIGWKGDPDALVFCGGPVQQETGWLLHEPVSGADGEGTLGLTPGLAVSTSAEMLGQLAQQPPERIRFMLGYAGWGAGQLEGELAQGSWLLSDVTADLIFATPHEEMWETALRRLHVDPNALVPASGVH
jgi:putative transcriptional regulator